MGRRNLLRPCVKPALKAVFLEGHNTEDIHICRQAKMGVVMTGKFFRTEQTVSVLKMLGFCPYEWPNVTILLKTSL
jgi:hypothetical protein